MPAALPPARVVRHKPWPATPPDAPLLGPAPRRVPGVLWIRLVFGDLVAQVTWFVAALTTMIVAVAMFQAAGQPPVEDDVPPVLVALIIVIVCAPMLLWRAWKTREQLHLLRHGRQTRGTLVGKVEIDGGEGSVYHYTFRYNLEGGSEQRVTIVTQLREERLEDEATEPMVYDPTGRLPAMPLDHLPGYPTIAADGELIARKPMFVHVLVFPLLTIVGLLSLLVGR